MAGEGLTKMIEEAVADTDALLYKLKTADGPKLEKHGRGPSKFLSSLVETATTIVAAPSLETSYDTTNCCEDCPDTTDKPPESSDCPYFDTSHGWPLCTRPDSSDNQIRSWLDG